MWLAFVAVAAAGENLIANGSFEEQGPTGAMHWTLSEGAYNGTHSPVSEVAWPSEDGSVVLRLHGDPSTRSWTTVATTDSVPVVSSDELLLSARMRNEGVRREGNQFDNCYLGVQLVDANGQRVGVKQMSLPDGDHAWTEQRIRFSVPEGATQARVIAFLSKSGTAWFDDIALETMHWSTARTEHFDFYFPSERPISREMQERNETELARAMTALGLTTAPRRISYYRYVDKTQKERWTGDAGNGHVQGTTIHTIWSVETHEMVHVLTQAWGDPDTAIFGEGIAVHIGGQWQGRPIDDYARDVLAAGKLPALQSIASIQDFRAQDSLVTYAAAGSFVGYLVRLKDMNAFRRVYVAGAPLDERLKAEYGKDLSQLDADWRASLAQN